MRKADFSRTIRLAVNKAETATGVKTVFAKGIVCVCVMLSFSQEERERRLVRIYGSKISTIERGSDVVVT